MMGQCQAGAVGGGRESRWDQQQGRAHKRSRRGRHPSLTCTPLPLSGTVTDTTYIDMYCEHLIDAKFCKGSSDFCLFVFAGARKSITM